jgi:hypothetical protein
MHTNPTVWIPHIPRTGGQSRHEMLKPISGYKRYDHNRNEGVPLRDRVVMGHQSVLENPDWIKILFVRDPIERFWSSYYYTHSWHPHITLDDYIKGTYVKDSTEDLPGYIPFSTTLNWLKYRQRCGGCNWQLDPYKWDYIFTVNELDKFAVAMKEIGYNQVANPVQVNSNNLDYSKLDTPELEVINTEYKYYTDLGVKL